MHPDKIKWLEEAKLVSFDDAAAKLPTKFTRSGSERTSINGCPVCGGKDRLSYNVAKGAWNCRGHGGGYDVVNFLQHTMSLSFDQACEELTGRPNPIGQTRTLSQFEKAELEKRKAKAAERKKHIEDEEKASQERKKQMALDIWKAGKPIAGTPAEAYLLNRGLSKREWSTQLRFHKGLTYYKDPDKPVYPALIARVSDMFGDFLGVWRIYITKDGQKAPVKAQEGCKIGLGAVSGGAVYLNGTEGSECIAGEGLETTLALEELFYKPGVATLSTSGMEGLQPPTSLESITIGADCDNWKYQENGEKWLQGQGQIVAERSAERFRKMNIDVPHVHLPPEGIDWLDVLNFARGRM